MDREGSSDLPELEGSDQRAWEGALAAHPSSILRTPNIPPGDGFSGLSDLGVPTGAPRNGHGKAARLNVRTPRIQTGRVFSDFSDLQGPSRIAAKQSWNSTPFEFSDPTIEAGRASPSDLEGPSIGRKGPRWIFGSRNFKPGEFLRFARFGGLRETHSRRHRNAAETHTSPWRARRRMTDGGNDGQGGAAGRGRSTEGEGPH